MCSSSKVPLQGHAILTTRSTGQLKARKKEQSAGVPSASLPTRQNEFVFPKLTISPLRKFQLLDSDSDSDSDHPPVSKDVNETAHIPDAVLKESKSVASQEKREAPSLVHQDDDLWKDFCPINNFRIATPALDEVCEEYFSSRKKQGDGSQKLQTNPCLDNNRNSFPKMTHMSLEQNWDSSNPLPPAHHYFLHKDPRIQNLVHSRLPNFLPIGVALDRSNQQPGSSAMNYTYCLYPHLTLLVLRFFCTFNEVLNIFVQSGANLSMEKLQNEKEHRVTMVKAQQGEGRNQKDQTPKTLQTPQKVGLTHGVLKTFPRMPVRDECMHLVNPLVIGIHPQKEKRWLQFS